MHYAHSIIHPVSAPAEAAQFFVNALSFVEKHATQDTHVVDNGALQLRLVQSGSGPSHANWPLEIEIITEDFDASTQALVGQGDVWELTREVSTASDRIEKRLGTIYGAVLVLTRQLTEDDLGTLPQLPATMPWTPNADGLVRRAVRRVPLVFRGSARKRITGRAEGLALAEDDDQVALPHAVRGLIDSTPGFQRSALIEFLTDEGVAAELLDEPADNG